MRFIEPLDAKLEVARMQPTIITDEDIAIIAGVAELLAAPAISRSVLYLRFVDSDLEHAGPENDAGG